LTRRRRRPARASTRERRPAPPARPCRELAATRPTAVNLRWALERMRRALTTLEPGERIDAAWREAEPIADEDVAMNRAIGEHGAALLRPIAARLGRPLALMTH